MTKGAAAGGTTGSSACGKREPEGSDEGPRLRDDVSGIAKPSPLPLSRGERGFVSPSLAETPKLPGTPPIRNPGDRPALSSRCASRLLVVVLPSVPATASTSRSASTCSPSHGGPEVYGRRASSMYSTAGLPRVMALPTTTLSGAGCRYSAL